MEAVKSPKIDTALRELFEAGAHFGYTKSRRHPSAKPFIFGVKNKIEIFDLEKTEQALERAVGFIATLGAERKPILFVGGKTPAREAVFLAAAKTGMPFVNGRWIGGTLSNFSEIRKRVLKLEQLLTEKEKGELAKYTKKERLLIDREIDKLRSYFEGLVLMKELPKALFVVDSRQEHNAVAEARALGIPVVALCGSDCDLKAVDYSIPANDSSKHSITFFIEKIAEAYVAGGKRSAQS